MKNLFVVVVLLSIESLAAAQGESIRRTLTDGGRSRTYNLYIPSEYLPSDPLPLVLNFHGFGGDADQQMRSSGMNVVAEQEGFIVAYPNAINRDWSRGGDHNLSFTDSLLGDIFSDYAIDKNRIYATGMSQGGMMSYTLGVARSDVFAAIASVSGTRIISGEQNRVPDFVPNTPSRPVPLLHIHGTSDDIVPYDGGNTNLPGFESIAFSSVETILDEWSVANGCLALGPELVVDERISRFEYLGCDTYRGISQPELVAEIVHLRVERGTHRWLVPNSQSDIGASQEVWSFFESHELAVVPEPNTRKLALPLCGLLSFRRRISGRGRRPES